uniref:Phospholipase A2 n=1 Tax=Rhabditophanes sp. KR3021 TaxID=114890 RepID=A0AC35TPP6_9BILA
MYTIFRGKHPDWTSLHIACASGISKYVISESKRNDWIVLLCQVDTDGKTALHISIENNQLEIVKMLIEKGADINRCDVKMENAIHKACKENMVACLKTMAVSDHFYKGINTENEYGETSLCLAIFSGSTSCVDFLLEHFAKKTQHRLKVKGFTRGSILERVTKLSNPNENVLKCLSSLISHYPELLNETIDKDGNCVLHVITDKKILQALLINAFRNNALNVDCKNRIGQTPLHHSILRKDLSALMTLYSYGANIDEIDQNGETGLHHSITVGAPQIVKALLCFHANINYIDNSGQTIRDKIEKLKNESVRNDIKSYLDIIESSETIQDQSDELENFAQTNAMAYQMSKNEEQKTRSVNVLSLDGGGIKGMVIIQTLLYFERTLGPEFIKKFDWISGTSTGAIIAVGLTEGKSLRNLQKMYLRFKDLVFVGSRPYSSDALKQIFVDNFGDRTMNDLEHSNKLLVTTCKASVVPPELNIFRNYLLPGVNIELNKKREYFKMDAIPIWKALRCSSAAPTYFNPVDDKYVDGGLIANNPCLEILTDIQLYNTALCYKNQKPYEISCVLSLGTGRCPPKQIGSVDVGLPSGWTDIVSKALNVINLKDMLIEQITAADGQPVTRARAWSHSLNAPYFRFSPMFKNEIELDQNDDNIIIEMLWTTEKYLREEANFEVNLFTRFMESFKK